MARIITSISFGLQFLAGVTPPTITVQFTEVHPDGHEDTGGRTTITDADAATLAARYLLADADPKPLAGLIADVSAIIDVQHAEVSAPANRALLIAERDDAKRAVREATAAKAALDEQIAAKRAELAALKASP